MDMNKGKNNKLNKGFKIAVCAAGLVVVFILGVNVSKLYYGQNDPDAVQESEEPLQTPAPALTQEEQEELYHSLKETAAQTETMATEAPDSSATEGLEYVSAIDFEYLWTVNKDIYAWITIPGTNIDYPILQHPTDDVFYLNHNLDGSYGFPGCIYTESLNDKDFSDPNTVIYGHDLKSKTMFTELHKFEKKDFFDEYNEVLIYLPDRTLHYQVFAAHVYDDRHLMYSFDFDNEDIFAGFLEDIYDIREMSANIDREMTVTAQDRIITMSTCMPNKADADKRLLVHAVLVSEEM